MKHSWHDRSGSAGRGRRPFTLIELLLVIGLMLMIMTFAVPAFQKLATGKSVDVASRMITGQLKLARAAAISEQKYLALVMPGNKFNAPSSTGTSQYHFRAFRVAEVKTTATKGEFEFVQWYPGTGWSFLPVGAVIAEVNGSYLHATGDPDCEIVGDDVNRKVYDDWKNAKDQDSILLEDASDDSVSKIFDSTDEGAEPMVSSSVSNTSSHWARAVVFDPKGRSCVGKESTGHRYITVMEANLSTEDQQTASEIDLQGMRIIKVNKLTGRTEYVETFRPHE